MQRTFETERGKYRAVDELYFEGVVRAIDGVLRVGVELDLETIRWRVHTDGRETMKPIPCDPGSEGLQSARGEDWRGSSAEKRREKLKSGTVVVTCGL